MNEYVIRMLGTDRENFNIKASDMFSAIEIFKGYGQYNPKRIYSIYSVEYEVFSDMTRQDLYYLGEI